MTHSVDILERLDLTYEAQRIRNWSKTIFAAVALLNALNVAGVPGISALRRKHHTEQPRR